MLKIILFFLISISLYGEVIEVGSGLWPPYVTKTKNGTIKGISVDILHEIGKRTGDTINFHIYPIKRLHKLFDNGHLHMNFADSKEWNSKSEQKKFVFSKPYLYVNEYIYSNQYFNHNIKEISNIYGQTVAIHKGYHYQLLEKDFNNKKIKKQEITTNKGMLKLLLRNRFSLAIFDDKLLDHLIKIEKLDRKKLIKKLKISSVPLGLKIIKSKEELLKRFNNAIEEMIEDKTIHKIIQKYDN